MAKFFLALGIGWGFLGAFLLFKRWGQADVLSEAVPLIIMGVFNVAIAWYLNRLYQRRRGGRR